MVIEKIWLQATQPLNTSVLWLDTSGANGILKMFFKGSWIPVGDAQVKRSEMGAANGVATLDANGKLVTSQIPEVIEMLSYGVEWDTSVSNPACTRVGNPPAS